MKIRKGFVSNSSSCSFFIYNKTNKSLSLVDFVKENPHLVEDFLEQYDLYKKDKKYSQETMIKNAKKRKQKFKPGQNYVSYGDEDGDVLGHVFDYILRDGGKSKSFTWVLNEFLR